MSKDSKSWFGRHKILTVIGVIVVLAIIGGAAGGSKSAKTTDTSSTASKTAPATAAATPTETKQPAVPAEYKYALVQAGTYSSNLHMSKQGVYDQLISPYGGKFSAEADYAIAHLND